MEIKIKHEVQTALDNNKAVVALESTIISHGMPYPENIHMAQKVEKIIRDKGAVPATIAILDGVVHVGLEDAELELLAKSDSVYKVSKRDFGFVLAGKKHGATTVSGTLLVADKVGIKVFATGGIGGVHYYAEETFDISRDLEELSTANVAVVCAGAKSILDLSKTLEYLETKGVEVIGYKTDYLPAFYTEKSAYKVAYNLDSPENIAGVMNAKWAFGLTGGMVIANPIPTEASMDEALIESTIKTALKEAKKQNVTGKDTTPFLLKYIKEATQGKSLQANLALVYNNAALAADIAVAYQKKVF